VKASVKELTRFVFWRCSVHFILTACVPWKKIYIWKGCDRERKHLLHMSSDVMTVESWKRTERKWQFELRIILALNRIDIKCEDSWMLRHTKSKSSRVFNEKRCAAWTWQFFIVHLSRKRKKPWRFFSFSHLSIPQKNENRHHFNSS
jgi:hypothetical protein